eukprot:818430-Prymnesium_polylepis.1
MLCLGRLSRSWTPFTREEAVCCLSSVHRAVPQICFGSWPRCGCGVRTGSTPANAAGQNHSTG